MHADGLVRTQGHNEVMPVMLGMWVHIGDPKACVAGDTTGGHSDMHVP